MDDRSVSNIEALQQNIVLERVAHEELARVTLDFDGSVLGTCRRAEGLGSIERKRVSAATTRCTARSPKQLRY
ncbi:hypothetical protein OAM69_02735 [bacterium]|nr:hypothetical protein [bacterium]